LDTKSCSFCREEISIGLRRCPYCGSLLEVEKQDNSVSYPNLQNFNSDMNVTQMCVEQNDDGTIVIKECEEKSADKENENDEFQAVKNITQNPVPSKASDVNNINGSLSNGLKVFLTIICTIIPGFGQLIGIIISVIFINSENSDRNSFGVALMVASLLFFLISCIAVFILVVALAIK
jgi:hypothetical protein